VIDLEQVNLEILNSKLDRLMVSASTIGQHITKQMNHFRAKQLDRGGKSFDPSNSCHHAPSDEVLVLLVQRKSAKTPVTSIPVGNIVEIAHYRIVRDD